MQRGPDLMESSTEGERDNKKQAPKQNCWEFKKCGREPGGAKVNELGVCPSATERRLHGIHEGRNAGRACWVVAGTFCRGELQGTFAQKYKNCISCDFYSVVKAEEEYKFQLSTLLLLKIKED